MINDLQSDINNNNWTDIDSIATFSSDEDDEFDGKQSPWRHFIYILWRHFTYNLYAILPMIVVYIILIVI